MASPAPEISVLHNAAAHRYEAAPDGHLSVVDYVEEDGRRVFTHTFVPDALRGRGVAAVLVRRALDDARRDGKKIVPACSYVAAFVERHAEYRDLVG